MRDAVLISVTRNPMGRAYQGASDAIPTPTFSLHAIRASTERAGVAPTAITDVKWGAALRQGYQAKIGRTAALRAGLPVAVLGMSVGRQCASSLMAVATTAKQIVVNPMGGTK